MRIAIVGAGLSGLSLGYFLKSKGHHVDIFERELQAGGVAGSLQSNGFVVERGPNSLMTNNLHFNRLVDELGLQRIFASSASKSRYVYLEGRLRKIPLGPAALIKSDLFSFSEKWRIVQEMFKKHSSSPPGESVYGFLERHFGAAVAHRVGLPMVVGVFGGDARELAIADAFPKALEFEKSRGSLLKGMKSGGPRPRLFTFQGGTGELVRALEQKLKGHVHLGERVMGMSPTKQIRTPRRFEQYEHVVFASSWSALAQIQTPASQEVELPKMATVTSPVVSLSFAIKGNAPFEGFGVLIHPDHKMKTLGILCPSNIFPNRAPAGSTLLTLVMGGVFYPQLASRPESEIRTVAIQEMQTVFGNLPAIEKAWCFKWPEGITQYTIQSSSVREALVRRLEQQCGLIIHSHAFGGVAVADCISKSHELCERLTKAQEGAPRLEG